MLTVLCSHPRDRSVMTLLLPTETLDFLWLCPRLAALELEQRREGNWPLCLHFVGVGGLCGGRERVAEQCERGGRRVREKQEQGLRGWSGVCTGSLAEVKVEEGQGCNWAHGWCRRALSQKAAWATC